MSARREIDSISESRPKNAKSSVSDIRITAVAGGNDRIESVQLALKYSGDADIVLVHDAARALTPPDVFRRVVAAVRAGAEAVVPVLPMTDTVRRAESRSVASPGRRPTANEATAVSAQRRGTGGRQSADESGEGSEQECSSGEVLHGDLDRSRLRRVQTPQGFTTAALRRAHATYEDELEADVESSGSGVLSATDDAGLVERLGIDVVAVAGDEEALKITYPLDLVLGEHIAAKRDAAAKNTRQQTMDEGEQ